MTKCQTYLVGKKIFHRFFWPFFVSETFNSKKKIFENFSFFLKNLTQNDPFWPFLALFGPFWDLKIFFWFFRALNMKNDGSYDKISLILIFGHFRSKYGFLGWKGGPKMAKNSKNIFLFFSRPRASFSYIITIYIDQISKSRFLGQKTGFLPKIRILEVFGKNPAVSVISKYHPQSPCRVSERSLGAVFFFDTDFLHWSPTNARSSVFLPLVGISIIWFNELSIIVSIKTLSRVLLKHKPFQSMILKSPASRTFFVSTVLKIDSQIFCIMNSSATSGL